MFMDPRKSWFIQGSRVVSEQAAFHLQHFFIQTCWLDVQQEAEELKEPFEGLWQCGLHLLIVTPTRPAKMNNKQ